MSPGVENNVWFGGEGDAPPPPGMRAEAPVAVAVSLAPARVERRKGHAFHAPLEVGEMDERGRPSVPWQARGREVSREYLVFQSRRMVRVGSMVIVAVHLVDDEPMPLFGKVMECEYETEGMHRVKVEFRTIPWDPDLRVWMQERTVR